MVSRENVIGAANDIIGYFDLKKEGYDFKECTCLLFISSKRIQQ